jgi:hypothetical protein
MGTSWSAYFVDVAVLVVVLLSMPQVPSTELAWWTST